jgi:hypothetical protein
MGGTRHEGDGCPGRSAARKWCAADPGPPQFLAVPDQRCTAFAAWSLSSGRAKRGPGDAASRPGHAIATAGFLTTDSLVKQPISFPRPHVCVRALPLCFTHPVRVGGAPRDVRVFSGTPVGVHVTRHARRLARRLASHDAGRSPLGAPPWRFWASGAALSSRIARLSFRFSEHPDRLQRAPRSQVVVPGGRGPYLPGQRLQAATAGRHTSLRIQDASRTRPSRARLRIF